MLTISYRVAALLGAGALLLGWLSASLVVPPTLVSQERSTPRHAVALPVAIPPVALDAVRPPRVRPSLARNPFAFSGPARAVRPDATGRAPSPSDLATATDTPDPATERVSAPWRLAGLAVDDAGGVTAIVTGDGDVHLLRAGDALGSATVDEVSASGVTLRFDTGRTLTLRLP